MIDPPAAIGNPYVIDGVDLRVLARRQRWVLWLVLLLLLCEFAPYLSGAGAVVAGGLGTYLQILLGVSLAIRITVVIYGVLFMRALRTNIIVIIIYAVLLFIPLLNLLILLLQNRHATKRLRRAGLKVGFMGVRDEQVVLKLAPNLCRQCGYDITGNVSGICPECGKPISAIGQYIANPIVK